MNIYLKLYFNIFIIIINIFVLISNEVAVWSVTMNECVDGEQRIGGSETCTNE